jgi:hypothetical protein
MSNRGSTSAFQTEIVKDENQPIHLVEIYFDSPTGTQYMTDSYMPVTYNSNEYLAGGHFLAFSDIQENIELMVSSINMSLTGIDKTYINLVLAENFVDRKVIIRKAFLATSNNALIADPVIIFQGSMDAPTISEDYETGTSVVTVKVANQFIDFQKTPGRYTNRESQNVFYPNDRGFDYASQIIKDIPWGSKFTYGERESGSRLVSGLVNSDFNNNEDIGENEIFVVAPNGSNIKVDAATGRITVVYGAHGFSVGDQVEVAGIEDDADLYTGGTAPNGTQDIVVRTEDTFGFGYSYIVGGVDEDNTGGSEITVDGTPAVAAIESTVGSSEVVIRYVDGSAVPGRSVHIGNVGTGNAQGLLPNGMNLDIVIATPQEIVANDGNTITVNITGDQDSTAPPLQTTSGESDVIINEQDHGKSTGDTVVIAGAVAAGGIGASSLNGSFTIGNVLNNFQYVIPTTGGNATSTVLNGGGASTTLDGNAPKPGPFSTTSGSATITMIQNAHGLAVSNKFSIRNVTEDVGGIPMSLLNGTHTVVSVPDANTITFALSQLATSTARGGGRYIIFELPEKATSTDAVGGHTWTLGVPTNLFPNIGAVFKV